MKKYKNKYRIPSARAEWWNYGNPGIYFITICTHNQQPYFGEIQNGIMCLNNIGSFLHNEWVKTPKIRPDMNIGLDEFIVMPDHFHALLTIGYNAYNSNTNDNHTENVKNEFGPQKKNLASVVRSVKSVVTTFARKTNSNFGWQTRFYDHIVRDQRSFKNISSYIKNNPANWKKKQLHKMDLK